MIGDTPERFGQPAILYWVKFSFNYNIKRKTSGFLFFFFCKKWSHPIGLYIEDLQAVSFFPHFVDTGKAVILTLIGKGQSVRPIPEVKSADY